jgi:hypothetical protein
VLIESHVRMIPILMALTASALAACHEERAAKTTKSPANPAEIKRLADSARQGLEGLGPPLDALNGQYAALQQRFDPLPPGLPGFGDTRAKFYSAAIGVGTLGSKLPWLTKRIDAAVKAGDRAELEAISKDIAHTHEEMRQADRIALELLPRVQTFAKLAEEKADDFRLTGKSTCE